MKHTIFKHKYTLLILTLLFTLLSCSSDENDKQTFTPTLPAITQTGENTFGSYIGGKLLTPRDGSGGIYGTPKGVKIIAGGIPPQITYTEIFIDDRKSDKGGLIRIHFENLNDMGSGQYIVNESNCQGNIDSPINTNIYCRVYDDEAQIFKWYCSIENAGVITITKYEDGIVSGTFSCTVQSQTDSNKQIEITQGRFDFNRATVSETEFP